MSQKYVYVERKPEELKEGFTQKYKNPLVKTLIDLTKEKGEFGPREVIEGYDPELILKLSEELFRDGILGRKQIDTIYRCEKPDCKRKLTLKPSCQKCGSTYLDKNILIEHRQGGHIHLLSEIKKVSNEEYSGVLSCPTCGKSLTQNKENKLDLSKIRKHGSWWICNDCNEKNPTPVFVHVCDSCVDDQGNHLKYSIEQIEPEHVFAYSLSPSVSQIIQIQKERVPLQLLVENLLKGMGYEFDSEYFVQGKSNIRHPFIKVTNRELPLITVTDGELTDGRVLEGGAIKIDIDHKPFVHVGRLSIDEEKRKNTQNTIKTYSGFYKFDIIAELESDAILKRLEEYLRQHEKP